jgi:hypothetical protein
MTASMVIIRALLGQHLEATGCHQEQMPYIGHDQMPGRHIGREMHVFCPFCGGSPVTFAPYVIGAPTTGDDTQPGADPRLPGIGHEQVIRVPALR